MRLIFTVRNSRRPRQHDLPDWWPSNRNKAGRDLPRRLAMKGSQVLLEVLRQIKGATMDPPDGTADPFVLRVVVPRESLGLYTTAAVEDWTFQ